MASFHSIPEQGSDPATVLAELEERRHGDLRWREGRAFSLVYNAGPEALSLASESYARFATENMLNLDAFPSLRLLQSELMSMVAPLLGGDDSTVGVFTAGGTESILTAVHGAKNWGLARGITEPRMVLPTTAHAAFSKAASYFGLESVRVRVDAGYRADVSAMAAAVDDRTVLLVASAPSYPQGVIDPIADLGEVAAANDTLFHVDACMGFTLPWLEQLGLVRTAWNFAVPAVTSMSCDLHKYGYAAKGASVLLHRDKALRRHQFFVTEDWLGGRYGSPAILGTRSGGGLAGAWAMFVHLGAEGYRRLAADAFEARCRIEAAVRSIPGLEVRGHPDTTLLAFGAVTGGDGQPAFDVFAVADRLSEVGGWFVDRQQPPDSLHMTVNAVHRGFVEEFVTDLRSCVADVTARSGARGDPTRGYGTLS